MRTTSTTKAVRVLSLAILLMAAGCKHKTQNTQPRHGVQSRPAAKATPVARAAQVLYGEVVDSDGKPIVGATIEVTASSEAPNVKDKKVVTLTTDAKGVYGRSDYVLPENHYSVRITKSGYNDNVDENELPKQGSHQWVVTTLYPPYYFDATAILHRLNYWDVRDRCGVPWDTSDDGNSLVNYLTYDTQGIDEGDAITLWFSSLQPNAPWMFDHAEHARSEGSNHELGMSDEELVRALPCLWESGYPK